MGVSRRQAQRLLRRLRAKGAVAVRHRARGRAPDDRIRGGVREHALTLVRENYADFGPMLAAEELTERHGLEVSRETARGSGWRPTGCGCPGRDGAASIALACDGSGWAS